MIYKKIFAQNVGLHVIDVLNIQKIIALNVKVCYFYLKDNVFRRVRRNILKIYN